MTSLGWGGEARVGGTEPGAAAPRPPWPGGAAPGYNVFAYVDGRWLTPGRGTLQGITRRSMIELARQAGQPVQEGCLSAEDLRRAAEVLGHLHGGRDHAGDRHRRPAGRHGRSRAADPPATGPLLGQPRGSAVLNPGPLRRAGLKDRSARTGSGRSTTARSGQLKFFLPNGPWFSLSSSRSAPIPGDAVRQGGTGRRRGTGRGLRVPQLL